MIQQSTEFAMSTLCSYLLLVQLCSVTLLIRTVLFRVHGYGVSPHVHGFSASPLTTVQSCSTPVLNMVRGFTTSSACIFEHNSGL